MMYLYWSVYVIIFGNLGKPFDPFSAVNNHVCAMVINRTHFMLASVYEMDNAIYLIIWNFFTHSFFTFSGS